MIKKFNYSLDNLRGLSILFIIISHLRSLKEYSNFLYFLFLDATTFFLFISGFLFSAINAKENFNFKSYLFKRFKNLISPFLLLCFIGICIGLYFNHHYFFSLSIAEYILWSYFVGGSIIGPLWFIPMFIIIILFNFIIIKLSDLHLYSLTLFFLFLSIITVRPYLNTNPFLSFIHFFGFYLYGVFCYKFSPFFSSLNLLKSIFLIFFSCFSFLFCYYFYLLEYNNAKFLYPNFNYNLFNLNFIQLGKFFLLNSFFILCFKFYNKPLKFFNFFSNMSVGLFFIHGFLMVIFNYIFYFYSLNSFFVVIFEFFFITLGSLLFLFLIKYFLNKWSVYFVGW